jgi:lysozyme
MTTLAGIDVSNNNGADFDWAAWRGKIAFAGVKISEGTGFADPDAKRNMGQARAEGLVRIAYHFLHPAESAAAQAEYFLRLARAAGLGPGDLVACDLETTDKLGAAEVAACAADFAKIIYGDLRAWPVTYTMQSFPENGYCAGLGGTPAWIADPSHVPLGSIGPWKLVSFEQTGQRGTDADVFYGDLGQLGRLAIPKPDPKPTPDAITLAEAKAALADGLSALAKVARYLDQG